RRRQPAVAGLLGRWRGPGHQPLILAELQSDVQSPRLGRNRGRGHGSSSVTKDTGVLPDGDLYHLGVRHDNRESIADTVSRTLGRKCLSRPTYLNSKDDKEHSLLVKRRLTTKCPDHAPQGLRSTVKATLLEL